MWLYWVESKYKKRPIRVIAIPTGDDMIRRWNRYEEQKGLRRDGPAVYNSKFNDAPAGAVYIGRGSRWGNPFQIGKHGTREEVIERFRCEVLPTLDCSELKGKDLVCYCAPLACHGDLLLKKANP